MKNLILLCFIGAVGSFGCQSAPAPATFANVPPTPGKTFVDQMKQKYNGDSSKLTPEERSQMDQITHGHTQVAMQISGKS